MGETPAPECFRLRECVTKMGCNSSVETSVVPAPNIAVKTPSVTWLPDAFDAFESPPERPWNARDAERPSGAWLEPRTVLRFDWVAWRFDEVAWRRPPPRRKEGRATRALAIVAALFLDWYDDAALRQVFPETSTFWFRATEKARIARAGAAVRNACALQAQLEREIRASVPGVWIGGVTYDPNDTTYVPWFGPKMTRHLPPLKGGVYVNFERCMRERLATWKLRAGPASYYTRATCCMDDFAWIIPRGSERTNLGGHRWQCLRCGTPRYINEHARWKVHVGVPRLRIPDVLVLVHERLLAHDKRAAHDGWRTTRDMNLYLLQHPRVLRTTSESPTGQRPCRAATEFAPPS